MLPAKFGHYRIRGVMNSWFILIYLTVLSHLKSIIIYLIEKPLDVKFLEALSWVLSYSFSISMISLNLSPNSPSIYLFADDATLMVADKNLRVLEIIVNLEFTRVSKWLKEAKKLTLNIKSNFVVFRPHQKIMPFVPQLTIFVPATNTFTNLEMKGPVKYLGVLIDSDLSWKYHIDHICHKVSKSIGVIAKLRHYVPRRLLLNIYHTLIVLYLTDGICGWGNFAQVHQNWLLVLQKRTLRLIFFGNAPEHAISFFVRANCLPLWFFFTICKWHNVWHSWPVCFYECSQSMYQN